MRRWALLLSLLAGCGAAYGIRHTVAPGEDLAALAARSGTTEAALRKLNRLGPEDSVRPGDTVFLPADPGKSPAARRALPAPEPSQAVAPPPPAVRERREAPPSLPAEQPAPPAAPAPPSAPGPAPLPSRPAPTKPPPVPRPPAPKPILAWPADGEVLRGFGKSPAGESLGIDIGVPAGTRVHAAASGRVIYAGTPTQAYGPLVIVDHGGRLHTVYSNLKELLVKRGDAVDSLQALGVSGNKAVGPLPHVHFEVRRNGDAVDPLLFLPPR